MTTELKLHLLNAYYFNRVDIVAAKGADEKIPSPILCGDKLNSLLLAHLTGENPVVVSNDKGSSKRGVFRIGSYTPHKESDTGDFRTRWTCIDVDGDNHGDGEEDPFATAQAIQSELSKLSLPSHLEKSGSGRGWHIWIFYNQSIPAADAKRIGEFVRGKDKIEVFPKQAVVEGDNPVGNMVWLPWWHGAADDGNQFYRIQYTGELESYVPEAFDTPASEQLETAIAIVRSSIPDTDFSKAKNTDPDGKDNAWQDWRREALSKLNLEDVYKTLTGRNNGDHWMECRDHKSPTGDRHPSAGVADGKGRAERGTFHSLRGTDSRTLSVFDYLIETGQASDFRHARKIIAKLSGVPMPKPNRPAAFSLDPESVLEEFNKKHAVLFVGQNSVILKESYSDDSKQCEVEFIRQPDFTLFYANRRVLIREDNGNGGYVEKELPAAKFWINHPRRRTYDALVFAPGQTEPNYYNLWRGFSVEPQPGDWSLFRNHIIDNICSGDKSLAKYVLTWMADAVQNPDNRPGVALVLRGDEGTGKGVFCREFGSLFGQHFKHISQSRHLTGNFNAHLKDCLLLYADEAFWAGDKAGEGALKALITEPQLIVEMKGRDAIRLQNRVRLLISSNNDWIVPAGLTSRRFCVIDVSDRRMQDPAYFAAIVDQLNHGGRAAMLHDLLRHDITQHKIDLRDIPKNEALFEQKIYSFDPIMQFWYDVLERGTLLPQHDEWKGFVATVHLYNDYIGMADKQRINHRASETTFGRKIRKLFPNAQYTRLSDYESNDGRRRCGYIYPPLSECRAAFNCAVKMTINWEKTFKEALQDDSASPDSQTNKGLVGDDPSSPPLTELTPF